MGGDCAKSVTGYISGNLLISFICGLLTYVVLLVSACPFAGLIALFVGIADLIPLVGATIGGAVAVIAGFIHSVPAGIAVLVFFVLYQQLENHLLQPLVFARTVKLNPLTVIIAILIGVELMGILGALLAIPVASMIQVILRDVWDHRRGRPKDEPTVGVDTGAGRRRRRRRPRDGEGGGPALRGAVAARLGGRPRSDAPAEPPSATTTGRRPPQPIAVSLHWRPPGSPQRGVPASLVLRTARDPGRPRRPTDRPLAAGRR